MHKPIPEIRTSNQSNHLKCWIKTPAKFQIKINTQTRYRDTNLNKPKYQKVKSLENLISEKTTQSGAKRIVLQKIL